MPNGEEKLKVSEARTVAIGPRECKQEAWNGRGSEKNPLVNRERRGDRNRRERERDRRRNERAREKKRERIE